MKKLIVLLICLLLCGCSTNENIEVENTTSYENATTISFKDGKAYLDGDEIKEYDYSWHVSPDQEDEYYTGEEPGDETIYVAHDIIYYPEIDESTYTLELYDDEEEWVTHYTNEELSAYIFATLPKLGNELPSEMMHSEEDAYDNPVLHICEAGTYVLQGQWHGQIWIDLGEDAFDDPTKTVTLVLNDVDITCDVAPGVVFYSVYEADNTWEEKEEYTNEIDISAAGARVILVDGTENNVTGANVYRLLKAKYKNEETTVQKKRYKMDGAFYSFMSLVIDGEEKGTGILNITSTTFEGLDSELHMNINGGYINIYSADDGINVNEDNVSVFELNGGHLTIFAGLGYEGDVIDSNGYININGGVIAGTSPSVSDEILDSEDGNYVSEEATVIAGGSTNMERQDMGMEMLGEMGDFDPNNTNFDPNNMPGNFDPNNTNNGQMPSGQQPPTANNQTQTNK